MPLIGKPDRSANQRPVFDWRETTWTHVLTRISEKTDFSGGKRGKTHLESIFSSSCRFLAFGLIHKWIQMTFPKKTQTCLNLVSRDSLLFLVKQKWFDLSLFSQLLLWSLLISSPPFFPLLRGKSNIYTCKHILAC